MSAPAATRARDTRTGDPSLMNTNRTAGAAPALEPLDAREARSIDGGSLLDPLVDAVKTVLRILTDDPADELGNCLPHG